MHRWLAPGLALAACGKHAGARKDAVPSPRDTVRGAMLDASPDAGLPACAAPVSGTTVTFRKLGTRNVPGIATLATSPPLDLRLFVVGADGRIWLFKDEQLQIAPFLDLSQPSGGPVTAGGEMGLLGLAFHPGWATNGIFYVYYTTGDIQTNTMRDVVAQCSVASPTDDVASPTSCHEVLSITDPAVNHNGGMMEFGRDGMLYIGTGDGGGNFNLPRSQDPNQLLGKMLRIDVDHPAAGKAYGIPADNPFAAGGGAPEVFMLGLRNPWRWSFDRATQDMWIGDVGAATIEEIDELSPTEQRGANLGWSPYEGSSCFAPPCDPTGKMFPKDERLHSNGWSAIIGGQVYRGTCYPDLAGWYFYADDGGGKYARAKLLTDGTLAIVDMQGTYPPRPTSLHEDARGELYLTDVSGYVYQLEAAP